MSFFVSESLVGVLDAEDIYSKKDSNFNKIRLCCHHKQQIIKFNIHEMKFNKNSCIVKIEGNTSHVENFQFKKIEIDNILFNKESLLVKSYELTSVKFNMQSGYSIELKCFY